MGNREELLAGAKRCLFEKGFARTTARDIATASGVSLAAIGYHFGSKEALLTEALQDAIAEWGDGVARLLGERSDFVTTWTKVIESFAGSGPLWAIQFELMAHLARNPELRAVFADANAEGRTGIAELVDGNGRDTAGDAATVGAFYQVLLVGLAAVWLADPESVPSGADLLAAMRAITARA
jgi:AcrR family transcriptional regulator